MTDPLLNLELDGDFVADCQALFKSPVGARVLAKLLAARNPVHHAFIADSRQSDHFHGGAQVVSVIATCSGWYEAMKPKAGPPTPPDNG